MTARIGKQVAFAGGSAISLLVDGKALVCESTPTIDRTMPAELARAKGHALIAAADEADQMATDPDRP